MNLLIDGKLRKVVDVIEGMRARHCQITPKHVQIKIDSDELPNRACSAITLPEHVWDSLKNDKVRIKTSGSIIESLGALHDY